jgi:hypothetical protein
MVKDEYRFVLQRMLDSREITLKCGICGYPITKALRTKVTTWCNEQGEYYFVHFACKCGLIDYKDKINTTILEALSKNPNTNLVQLARKLNINKQKYIC